MSREVIIKVLDREEIDAHARKSFYIDEETHEAKVELLAPYQNMGELIRCKDCKHRPILKREFHNGIDLEFPTDMCPCRCDGDEYYSWMPEDYWFCPCGERKEDCL